MKTRIIFVRHAEAEGNISRRFHGWTDSSITEKGHKQAKLMAARIRDMHIDCIYSSSLKRTLETAGYISDITNLKIKISDKLWEINGGEWEGKRWEDLPIIWPNVYDSWEHDPVNLEMPNGETMKDFKDRLINEFNRILDENKGKTVCIVTHGTAIKLLMTVFRGKNINEMANMHWQDNTAITVIDCNGEGYEIIHEGDASHLNDEMSTIKNQDWYYKYSEKINSGKSEE